MAFVAMAFWEAYIEGKYPWAKRQVGWEKRISNHWTLTGYHFWVYVMLLLFLTLPLVTSGFSWRLLGLLIFAASLGTNLEDFLWYVINPFYGLKNFNPRDAPWYRWTKIGPVTLPTSYYVAFLLAFLSWFFLVR